MILSGFGVELRRIVYSDIELIRNWRNSYNVRKWMFYEELITETQQEGWFEQINNSLNYYFIIHVGTEPIGLIYAKHVNLAKMIGEGGIFVGNPRFLSTDFPARATFLMLYFCFNQLGLKHSLIRIKKGNELAINYNKMFGYKIISIVGNEINFELNKNNFESSKYVQKLLKMLPLESIQLNGTPSDKNLDIINEILRLDR